MKHYNKCLYDLEIKDNHNYYANNMLVHNCNRLVIQGLLGDIISVATTTELIENKTLNAFKVRCIVLDYAEEEKKAARSFEWEDEVQFLISNKARTQFISKLASSLKGNTLILFSRVETHGELIYNEIQRICKHRKVYFISGKVKGHVREATRKEVEEATDAIIVASSQIFSTGINIKSLQNIIFTHPSKSRIRVLQSIGRVLRTLTGKGTSVLYDIVDDLRYNKKQNFSYKHFVERVRLYVSENFPYTLTSFSLRSEKKEAKDQFDL